MGVEGETRAGGGGGRVVTSDWWRWISRGTVDHTIEELQGEERMTRPSLAWKGLVPQKINRNPISETQTDLVRSILIH